MSKNKRYKRLAKRILGQCTTGWYTKDCFICPYDNNECECIIANTNHIPSDLDIRTIERICKYGK